MIWLLMLATWIIYWRTMDYGLVSDDIPAHKRTLEKPPKTRWQRVYQEFRGVVHPRTGHALSIAFHSINVGLIYQAFGFWTAALFMVNPVTLMASTWISGRAYSMVTTFALVSWLIPILCPALYFLGVYWNISALFFPFIMGTQGLGWLSLFVVIGVYWRFNPKYRWGGTLIGTQVKGSKINNESNAELRALRPRKLIIFVKTYGYYFRETLTSFRLGLFHKFLYTYGLRKDENKKAYSLDMDFAWGILCLVVTGLGIHYGQYPVQVGLLWFIINVGMWCNLITFHQQIAERYLYLPAVGLMIVVATILPPVALACLFVYYLTRLWWFMPSFINEYWNVEYNTMECRDLYYIWLSRGVHNYSEGNFHGALFCLIRSYERKPDDFKTNINLFYVALALNNVGLAKKHLEEASKCVVEGKEEELKGFVDYGKAMLQKIEEGFKNGGSYRIDLKDMKLLL